jgi:hypothetical protein
VIAWTLPRAKSGWPAIAFISCSCVAKSSAIISLRAESYGPPSLIASAIPVSCSWRTRLFPGVLTLRA